MRIRSTKPEFWRSETIASLDWDARLILKGVESYVDDNGVGKDSEVLICADVFPHDLARDRDTLARVSRGLQALCNADLIARYCVNGERLLYVRNWKSIQRVDRPNKGRHPRPDGTLEYTDDVDESVCAGLGADHTDSDESEPVDSRDPRDSLATPSRQSRETPLTGTGEQGNRGTGKTRAPAPPDAAALFDPEPTAPSPTEPATAATPKPEALEQTVTTAAYERVGKAFNFIAVRKIVKWALHERGADPDTVERAVVSVYEFGKPITKTTVGQFLDGRIRQFGPVADTTRPDAPRDVKSGLLVER